MAKTSIANPVVVLSLDANPFTAGLEKAKNSGSSAAKEIAAATKAAATAASAATKAATDIAAKGVAADVAAVVAATKAKVAAEVAAITAITKAKLQADAGALAAAKTTAAKAAGLAAKPMKTTRGGVLGGIIGAAGGLSGLASRSIMPIIAANQAMEFANKISKTIGAPMRALMGREQLQAQFSGIGTIDPSTSTTFTAGIARFGMAFDSMLADIAEALDRTFDLRGILEYARGALTGISELMTAFFANLEPIVKDPEALTKQFKAGALMVVNVFEAVGVTSAKIGNFFIEMYKTVSGMKGIFSAMTDQLAIGLSTALEAVYLVPAGTTALLEQDALQNANRQAKAAAAAFKPFNEQAPVNIANQARGAINAMGQNGEIGMTEKQKEELRMRQANVIMGKIGSNLMPQVTSKIAPLMVAGSSQLEDALVKAQLQGEAGDIQQRIEAAIKDQITLQTQQVRVLGQIKTAITGRPDLAVLGNN